MKYYAVIDTNVLVSAMLKWDSLPGNVMELVFTGSIVPVVSEEIVREYREVLARPKFHFTDRIICEVLENIERQAVYINVTSLVPCEELPDPKDQVFYEVVAEERKTEDAYLVTGNIKHFPKRTFIVTSREMLNIILSNAA
ncbi:MAG: putative toxin-antitoxin system toxin component, PIN family [Lachnospiraceae bacterium]|nr:putative toxin-antitoxin system toxin component, PIN family [Lachnospiraceae bacterium]